MLTYRASRRGGGKGRWRDTFDFYVAPVLPITGRIPLRPENTVARRPEIGPVLVPRHWGHDASLQTSEAEQ